MFEGPSSFEHFEREKDPREKFTENVHELLDRENFIIDPEDKELFAEQIKTNKRYIYVVGEHQEGDQKMERFLKIPVNDNPDIDEPFRRQIEFERFLKKDGRIKTRDVITANTDRQQGMPFAIMETFSGADAEIGFIANHEDMELLTDREARSCIKTLEKLQQINTKSLPPELLDVMPKFNGNYQNLLEDMISTLNEKVVALDSPNQKEESFHTVLNRRLGAENFKERTLELVEYWKNIIKKQENKGNFLVHGDLSPVNLYVYDNGEVEFLDWEWSGVCDNRAIATIIDFGNLRARAWNNKEFREGLDAALIESYKSRGQEELGRAIVSLGILRSHMGLAGFFENYDLNKQRQEEEQRRRDLTENDIVKAWEIAGQDFFKRKQV